MIGVYLTVAIGVFQTDGTCFYIARDELADVFHRRQSLVVVFQGIVGMRIGSDDVFGPAVDNGVGIHLLHGLKEHLFAEATDLVAAVLLHFPKDAEI